jgi:hypothetical protein
LLVFGDYRHSGSCINLDANSLSIYQRNGRDVDFPMVNIGSSVSLALGFSSSAETYFVGCDLCLLGLLLKLDVLRAE